MIMIPITKPAAKADSDAISGGANVLATKNIPYSLIYPISQMLVPNNTFAAPAIKATTGRSFAGNETSFQKQTEFQTIKFNENNRLHVQRIITYNI